MKMLSTTLFLLTAAAIVGTLERSEASAQQAELACITMNTERLPLDSRVSPLDSLSFEVQGHPAKICYGRPSARGREIFGGLVAYDKLWRTGANEPTMIHTSAALDIAGITIEPGSYSLYTVPGESEWQVVINGSTSQWGHEGNYNEEVQSHEVGRASLSSGPADDYVEMFTIRAEPTEDGNTVVLLEWENTRVSIPISVTE